MGGSAVQVAQVDDRGAVSIINVTWVDDEVTVLLLVNMTWVDDEITAEECEEADADGEG